MLISDVYVMKTRSHQYLPDDCLQALARSHLTAASCQEPAASDFDTSLPDASPVPVQKRQPAQTRQRRFQPVPDVDAPKPVRRILHRNAVLVEKDKEEADARMRNVKTVWDQQHLRTGKCIADGFDSLADTTSTHLLGHRKAR